jgi:hypothetical protein
MVNKSKINKLNGRVTHRNRKIPIKCIHCKELFSIKVNSKDYESWKSGDGFIQDILWYLSAPERELLITNTCGNCFDAIYGIEGEYDECTD